MSSTAMTQEVPPIHGGAEPGFGRVVDAFAGNFSDRGDVGAACTVYLDGRKVVDVWAGVADTRTGRPWEEDTAAVLFSCTKGVVTVCAYLLVQDGRLDLDVPVATYWPEFAECGKHTVTLRQILAHRAGLPAVEAPLTRADICAWEPAVRELQRQRPMWEPGTTHSYHPITHGWLVGEVIRRITGLTPGRFLRQAVSGPLGLDLWIGLPDDVRSRVAWMEPPLPDEDSPYIRQVAAVQASPAVLQAMTFGGSLPFPTDNGVVTLNDPAVQAAELPGANGIGTPRSLARLYAGCVSDLGGTRILTPQSVADALVPQSWGQMALGDPDFGQRWGSGFMLSSPPARPMLSDRSFGHDGTGGQLGFADDTYGVGFAYLSCQLGPVVDHRANELTRALGACLGAPEPVRRTPTPHQTSHPLGIASP